MYAIGEVADHLQIMLDPQDRHLPVKAQAQDKARKIFFFVTREPAARLVEEQKFGIGGHRPGKADDLLLAIRQIMRANVTNRPKLEKIDDAFGRLPLGNLAPSAATEKERGFENISAETAVTRD